MLSVVDRRTVNSQPEDRILEDADPLVRLVQALDELERYVEIELAAHGVVDMDPWIADDDAIAIRALSL
jgi:hypothetical protein